MGAINNIRQFFTPLTDIIILQIGNVNYTFSLSENEQFYLILKTRRQNETFVAIQ